MPKRTVLKKELEKLEQQRHTKREHIDALWKRGYSFYEERSNQLDQHKGGESFLERWWVEFAERLNALKRKSNQQRIEENVKGGATATEDDFREMFTKMSPGDLEVIDLNDYDLSGSYLALLKYGIRGENCYWEFGLEDSENNLLTIHCLPAS